MPTIYVGLDVHWKHTTVCILDRERRSLFDNSQSNLRPRGSSS